MWDSYGLVYIYLVYGNYYCLNFTCVKKGVGAVLVRAVEPLEGIEEMQLRRKQDSVHALCSGPGKLCQAFNITIAQNGEKVGQGIKILRARSGLKVKAAERIGIRTGRDSQLKWRFYIKGNEFVSRE